MWSGTTTNIPSGWVLCNGSNGTPDLRDRFIVGAGSSYSVGSTGGADSVTLTTTQMPSHNHTISLSSLSASSSGGHTHSLSNLQTNPVSMISVDSWGYGTAKLLSCNSATSGYYTGTLSFSISGNMGTAGAHTHSITGSASIGNIGSGSSHENRPPYYALCFIMKV